MNFVRVDGFPKYVIHPCGTILNLRLNHTREVKHCKTINEYMNIGLTNNGKRKHFRVHRLLALHFIPNSENKPQIDHINGVRDDNRLENLRWVTHMENMNSFRSNPPAAITKGSIAKVKSGSWRWDYLMKGKKKSETIYRLEDLLKFRKEKLKKYNIIV